MFKTAVLTATAASVAANVHPREVYEREFFEWMGKNEVSFENGSEFIQRLQNFADNHDLIEAHNAKKSGFTLAHNSLSHLSQEEFEAHYNLGKAINPSKLRVNPNGPKHGASNSSPDAMDWVDAGAVSGVKDQGNCGSCWSFSTTGSLEGAYSLKFGNAGGVVSTFSEQHLVSCDTIDSGCNGGWMDNAFGWIKRNGGICSESDYPYTSGDTAEDGTCNSSSCTSDSKVAPSGYTDVEVGDVSALQSAVAQQPVSIAIQANQPAFRFYKGGVIDSGCGQKLDHGVLNVGYGTDASTGEDFWKVKNSWGPDWGEDGYVRILKSDDDLCGVLDAASYPTL